MQVAARLRLPRVAVMGIKDLSRRPARAAMTVAALVIAVITATFSLGLESTFDKTLTDPTVVGGPPFDIAASRDAFPDVASRAVLEQNAAVEAYLPVLQTVVRFGRFGIDVWAFEGDLTDPVWAMNSGRMPESKGEAAVSLNMAEQFGLVVGQTLTLTTNDFLSQDFEVTIVGTFPSSEDAVMNLLIETLPGTTAPTDYLITTRAGEDNRAVANSLIAASGGNLDPELFSEEVEEVRDEFRPILLGLNLVLFGIAGINLLSSQLLSVRERRRDFAILKTLGFTPAQITASVLSGSMFLALVALAIGIPLGLVATRVLFDILTNAAGIGSGVGSLPGVLWLLPLLPIVLLVAALMSALPARTASKLEVAEALRYE